MPASSSGSSNTHDGNDARSFFQEWRAAEDRYSEAIQNNGQLEIYLGVFQAALNVAEEEANAVQARLAKSDAAVAGKTRSMNISILVPITFVLIFFCNPSPNGAIGASSIGGERSRGRRQCQGFPH